MLGYLRVKDFALIEDVELQFSHGLNVLTGETGAGKTVLVEALSLLLGDRADSMMVRDGANEALLTCTFELKELDQLLETLKQKGFVGEGEEDISLSRTIPRNGKSRSFINGRACQVSDLTDLGGLLVDIHGQNSHQALLDVSNHLEYLDRFAGEEHLKHLSGYKSHYQKLRSLLREKSEFLFGEDIKKEEEFLRSEIEEIDRLDFRPGELEELEERANRLRSAKLLAENCSQAQEFLVSEDELYPSARSSLLQAAGHIKKALEIDRRLDNIAERIEALVIETEELASELFSYKEEFFADPASLEELEARISDLRSLVRKYGRNLADVARYRDRAKEKLSRIENSKVRMEKIEEEIAGEREELKRLSASLSDGRTKAASLLEKAVVGEFKEIELSGAGFGVSVTQPKLEEFGEGDTDCYGPSGIDKVEFLFCPAGGESLKPLRRIASGGEMSRVMLALKIVLDRADRIPVLLFDEVDSGIGGKTASRVGEKLAKLASCHQVFCITHLPQLAVYADRQYRVAKRKMGRGVKTVVEALDWDGRVAELCRMFGDSQEREVTEKHARDMLERAQTKKQAICR